MSEHQSHTNVSKSSGDIFAASDADLEIHAMSLIFRALAPLKNDAQKRVLTYISQRLSIQAPLSTGEFEKHDSIRNVLPLQPPNVDHPSDVRSLAEQKKPETLNEKAALVAYFLSELASGEEKRQSIGQDEIIKYFKQAGFPLPGKPSMTLVHAKDAGFFELVSAGQYRLNAVGYNLVAHRLPKNGEASVKPSARTNKRAVTQAVKKAAKKAKK